MHIFSSRNRSEFLAVPQLVRFSLPKGSQGPEATLLVKSTSLILKYLLTKKKFKILFFPLQRHYLGYGVEIEDDKMHPAFHWSLLEYDDELAALQYLVANPNLIIHVFNEIAINVFWGEIEIDISSDGLADIVNNAQLHPIGDLKAADEMHQAAEGIFYGRVHPPNGYRLNSPDNIKWHELRNDYVTNRLERSSVSIFSFDEGGQQEKIALWLTDNLDPVGAVKGPQVFEPKKQPRELSDLLLTYEYGSFLFESKTLNILSRENLPEQDKLKSDICKHLRKATRQLEGGLKNLFRGYEIKDNNGNLIDVNRTHLPHAIIIVPDLHLINELYEFGGDFIKEFMLRTNAFLHFLDLAELLRVVQAAEMISGKSQNLNKLMAFDHYLLERSKRAIRSRSPAMHVLYRDRW